jgi:hypothetical protein
VTILIPIPGEIGVTALSGVGVLIAYGVSAAKAAVIVLGLRILATGFTVRGMRPVPETRTRGLQPGAGPPVALPE